MDEPGKKGTYGEQTRFFADAMLGKLARWMRTLGCDVEYAKEIGDAQLVLKALAQGRVILTRDRLLANRRSVHGRCLFIESDAIGAQLRQVVKAFGIGKTPALTRCLRCNTLLGYADKGSVKGLVPQFIYETHDAFSVCASCKRVYWCGSHKARMLEEIERMIGEDSGGTAR